MTDKVFMIFNDNINKHKQACWFIKSFIKDEHQDLDYLFGAGAEIVTEACGIACNKFVDGCWVWLEERTDRGYTKGMTQVYYETKDLGEL